MISDKPTYDESVLIHILRLTKDVEIRAALLQVFLADEGPLSEPAGKIVREILHEKFETQSTADRLRAQGINPETFLPSEPQRSSS